MSLLARCWAFARLPLLLILFGSAAANLSLTACQPSAPEAAGRRLGRDAQALTLANIYERSGGAREVAISPDGSWLAVVGSDPRGSGISLMRVGEQEPTRRLSGGSPAWGPDGRRLSFVREGELWVAEMGAGEPRRLVGGMEGVRDPVWSPTGETIAFYSTTGGAQDIWLVGSEAGEARQLTSAAAALDDSRFRPAWSPDGESIAYVSNRAGYWRDDVWVIDTRTGTSRPVSLTFMATSSPVWSPDGRRIALFGTARDVYWYQDLSDLYLLEPGTGTEEVVEMQVFASDFIMRHRPFWSSDGEWLYFPYHERGAFDLWVVPAHGGVATRVSDLGGLWSSLDASQGAERFAFVRSGPTEGPDVWVLDGSGGTPVRATFLAPEWAGLREPIEVSYRSFDGLYIQAFLYLPHPIRDALETIAAESGSVWAWLRGLEELERPYDGPVCPALVQVHGGGTNSYYQGLNLTEQYLATRGYVVLAINYRGGSGFGREFQDLNVEDWLNDQAKDPGAAADWLRFLPFVTGKVGIYGGSYGGSMSLGALTLTPDKLDAAVPMRGAYSKRSTLEFTDRLGKIFTITGHGGTPEERPDTYAKSDVVSRIDRITAPVLLMHGELDRRAPIQHFQLAVEELKRQGKEFETETYPTEGHGFRDPANRVDMYSRLEEFFRRHLGSCAPPL